MDHGFRDVEALLVVTRCHADGGLKSRKTPKA